MLRFGKLERVSTDHQSTGALPDAIAVLQRFFAAEAAYISASSSGEAGFAELAACLDPNVVMHQAASLPYGGPWRGPEGIEAFIRAMSDTWQSLEIFEQWFIVDGDAVAVHNRGRLCARSTGRAVDTEVVQLMKLRNGLIAEIRPFYLDTAAVLDALAADTRSVVAYEYRQGHG